MAFVRCQHSAGGQAFVLATSSATKIRLVQSSGKCPGALSQMHSFRAENIGVLTGITAASQIISKLYTIADAPAATAPLIQMSLKVYCDNNALVKRISRWRRLHWFYPNECLVNDFDVSHQLLIQSKLFQNVTFNHVRGHQDSRKNKDQLTLSKWGCMGTSITDIYIINTSRMRVLVSTVTRSVTILRS